MPTEVDFTCNGNQVRMAVEDHWTLLHLLRERLELSGTKEGCGSGECGACTVIVDDEAINACLYPAPEIDGRAVWTIEGLATPEGGLHPLQQAFVEHGGIQCGFCTPGMIMAAKALLDSNPAADEAAIRHALAGNICRCTGYLQIFESIKAATRSSARDVNVMAWQAEDDTQP